MFNTRYYNRLVLPLLMFLIILSCKKDDLDTTSPRIEYLFPPEYSILSDIEVVRVLAQDNDGIRSVVYLADGDSVGVEHTAPHTLLWNTTAYPDCTGADSYVTLTAIAEDFTGNTASADRIFYLDNAGLPPLAVELLDPTDITKHTVQLSWEQSVDYDFSHYVLYRDTVSTVGSNSDSLVTITAPGDNRYTDMGTSVSSYGLLENSTYYYRVFTHDTFGRSRGSDSAAAALTLLPQSVTLQSPPSNVTKYTVTLSWNALENDVAYYRIQRGDTLALDSIAMTLPSQTTYTDTGLFADSLYYYHVYTVDEAGFSSPLNPTTTIAVRTATLPTPGLTTTPLDITKYSATIGWADIAQQEDSSWLDLFAGVDGVIDTTGIPIVVLPNGSALSYRNYPIRQNTTHTYRLRHRDSRNNQKWSNTLNLTTLSIADVWNGALGRGSSQKKSEIGLHWDPYIYTIEGDFADYTITRDGQVVFTSTNSSESDFTDTGLLRNQAYNYELTITDTSGATIPSSSTFSTRDIYTANLDDIYVTEEWDFHLAWQPSSEPIEEFDYYAIYRTSDANVTFEDDDRDNLPDCAPGNCEEAGRVTDRDPIGIDTAVVFVDVDPNLVRLRSYYYSILTYDTNGEFAPSNILGDTLYIYPSPVTVEIPDTLVTPTTLGLIWSRASWGSVEADAAAFQSYEVWRNGVADELPGGDESSYQLINTEPDIDNTTYTDAGVDGLIPGDSYYYTVILRDVFGLSAASEEVLGITHP